MTMRKIYTLLFVLFLVVFKSSGQSVDLEKTYEITGKSKRGALANVEFDKEKGYTLTYVTKSNEKIARFQIYTFDKDFNFINMSEEELEFEKAKTRFSWFKFRGEEYSVEGIYVEPTVTGMLVLRKKLVTFKYDWLFLGYYTTTKVLDKVKPRSVDGSRYFYYTHAEDDVTGDVCILTGDRSIKEALGQNKYFSMLRFNSNLELVKETKFSNQYPQTLAFSRTILKDNPNDPDNQLFGGMVFVFAPMGGQGFNKYANENKCAYTFVHVDENLDIVDNIPFGSYSSYWQIDELITDSDGNIYIYGPSAAGKDKYFNQEAGKGQGTVAGVEVSRKFKAVQLMKVANHKIEYFTETSLEEFASKIKKPASQKKNPEYEGKKFDIAKYYVTTNRDLFITGQNFNNTRDGKKFTDVLGFWFDRDGKLHAQYGVDTKESNMYAKAAGAPQDIIASADGSSLYWLLLEIRGVMFFKHKPLTYPRIGKIDLATGNVGDFLDVRGPDDDYYLDAKFPFIESKADNMLTFFGSDKKGNNIWFVRVKI